jgi:excisionase family DNA binding protein
VTFDQVVREQLREVVREEIRAAFSEHRGGVEDAPLTYRQAAKLLGCHPNTIASWRRRGLLPATGTGRMTRVLRGDVLRALDQLKAPAVTTDESPEEFARRVISSKKPKGGR